MGEKNEVILKGIGVSPGIVVHRAQVVKSKSLKAVKRSIAAGDVDGEVKRFKKALKETQRQIRHIQKEVSSALGQEHANIFDAHILVVDDPSFIDDIIQHLNETLVNIEAVLQQVSDRYIAMFSKVKDSYLAERAADIRDVTKRIMANLVGESLDQMAQVKDPCILVAHDLSPSDTAMIDKNLVLAFVTDLGSPTSHTAIMAKALGVPAVVGLHNVSASVAVGDDLLIDGSRGLIFINPSEERLIEYEKRAIEQQQILEELDTLRDKSPETKDGYLVPITANIELLEELDNVGAQGAKGIGLYRTEFLFLGAETMPNEEEQILAYEKAAKSQYPSPVVIRTLDLGADKLPANIDVSDETNPFLGMRAIRFCLAHPQIFKTQLRAILRASVLGNIRMMYPLVSNVQEVIEANKLLHECMDELRAEGIAFDEDIKVGTMIEVPSAALIADLIAPHVSFFSLGTNDLIQYTVAVDRGNENVAHLYKPTHVAIIRLIDHVVRVSHEHGLWTCVCGQMASTPLLVPLLIGLGVDELSVSPSQAPVVKDVIRKSSYLNATDLARKSLAAGSAEDIDALCREMLEEIAPEVLEL